MLLEQWGMVRASYCFVTHRLNLDVNYRVMANPTLSTTTVLPQTSAINPVCGVSGFSSNHRGPRCTDVNRPNPALPQQNRHDLDLQLRF
jgi:hypothetical protein